MTTVTVLVLERFTFITFGMYLWEIAMNLPFDWALLSRKLPFRWPYVFYLMSRYFLLATFILYQIFSLATSDPNCQAILIASGVFGNFSIGLSSVLLAIRTIAIWSKNKLILIVLALFGIAQWACLIRNVVERSAHWSPITKSCITTSMGKNSLIVLYLPTMIFDLLVLAFGSVGLRLHGRLRSPLGVLVFKQGIVYFFLAFVANLLPVIFTLLGSPITLVLLFCFTANFVSSVSACRLVRELALYGEKEEARRKLVEMYGPFARIRQPPGSQHKEATDGIQFTTNIDLSIIVEKDESTANHDSISISESS